jgi:hypothetical protein
MGSGSWSIGVEWWTTSPHGRYLPPVRARLAHVAPGGGGLACPTRLAGGRPRARRAGDHRPPLFRLTVAKLRYSSTRRRAPAYHSEQTPREHERCTARQLAYVVSQDDTTREHLEKSDAIANYVPILVSPIHRSKPPAASAGVQILDKAVASTGARVRFDRITAVLTAQEDRLEMPFAPICRLHEAARHQSFSRFVGSKAERCTVSRIDRDRFRLSRHVR